ncbi:hypothetical protein GCM10022247_05100 [Allokutzneria multivorans]|uniref:MFS transporter n=1 Tax=Allokutzneria multivorans TaxID=1142134 RepID=A0ABP7QXJ1_9PSEU
MPEATTDAAHPDMGLRGVLIVLCRAEITSWGVLFCARQVVGVPIGRWLDRFGPRVVTSWGSVLAVGALSAFASAVVPGPAILLITGSVLVG